MNPYLVATVVVINVAIFTFFDAARLRDSFHIGVGPKGIAPHAWASLVVLFLPLALPYYLTVRRSAAAAPSREGPPPIFTARDLNLWGYVSGVGFLAAAVYLGLIGELWWSALAGLAMVTGLFGGRTAKQSSKQDFDLGRAAWDMSAFRPVEGVDIDDEEVVEGYGGYIPPIADSAGHVRPAPPAGGVDVFAPLPTALSSSSASSPASAPASSPSPSPGPPVFADAAPVVGKIAHDDDDDVWDPVRADEEAQRASKPAPELPPLPPLPPMAPAAPIQLGEELPPGLVDDEEPAWVDDDLAPFELAPDEDDEFDDDPVTEEELELDEELELLAPLPPLATNRPPSARGPSVPQAPADRQPRPPRSPSPGASPPVSASALGEAVAEALPEAVSAPRPVRAGSPQQRVQGGAPPVGFAGVARSSSGPPAVLLWFLGIGVLLLAAWWFSGSVETEVGSEEPPDATVVGADADVPAPTLAPSDGLTVEARERADAAEEIMRRKMNGWIATYDSVMRPIATLVEDIDFNGLRRGVCMELQKNAESADSQLEHAPDEEIELLLRPAFDAFMMAGNACVVGDEVLWSVHLLQGKDHTHETQLLLDERYRYVGPYELEQEEALGHSRSLDTISGRYLAGELEETDIEAVPVN